MYEWLYCSAEDDTYEPEDGEDEGDDEEEAGEGDAANDAGGVDEVSSDARAPIEEGGEGAEEAEEAANDVLDSYVDYKLDQLKDEKM